MTREVLDSQRCATPGCEIDHGPLYIHARCHPLAQLQACYEDGVVTFECGECSAFVVAVAVAAEQ